VGRFGQTQHIRLLLVAMNESGFLYDNLKNEMHELAIE
jgi:hypothetical protein